MTLFTGALFDGGVAVYELVVWLQSSVPAWLESLLNLLAPLLMCDPICLRLAEPLAVRIHQEHLTVATQGRGPVEISDPISALLRPSQMNTGLCHLFCCHTSASLAITENADPTVLKDLEGYLGRSVPDGDPRYAHSMEGPDDMSAHIRSVLTGSGLTIPFGRGKLCLGTWQGIFLWEHRTHRHTRTVIATLLGE